MELSKKLQQLRKQNSITQEELAGKIFVSRTAISKWESARGYPSIDSLKAIAQTFNISIDVLLSNEELVLLAENEQREKTMNMQSLVFGLLDCMIVLLFFLPLFGHQTTEKVITVPLISLTWVNDYIWLAFVIILVSIVVFGVIQLALQNWQNKKWLKYKIAISLVLNILAITLTILSRQPYPGFLLFCILILKGILVWKKQ